MEEGRWKEENEEIGRKRKNEGKEEMKKKSGLPQSWKEKNRTRQRSKKKISIH